MFSGWLTHCSQINCSCEELRKSCLTLYSQTNGGTVEQQSFPRLNLFAFMFVIPRREGIAEKGTGVNHTKAGFNF